jgi:hypothetical protein
MRTLIHLHGQPEVSAPKHGGYMRFAFGVDPFDNTERNVYLWPDSSHHWVECAYHPKDAAELGWALDRVSYMRPQGADSCAGSAWVTYRYETSGGTGVNSTIFWPKFVMDPAKLG